MEKRQLALVMAAILLLAVACNGSTDYITCVNQVSPEIPGLSITGVGPTFYGAIYIANRAGKDFYLMDQAGSEVVWIESEGGVHFRHSGEDDWETNDGSVITYSRPPVYYGGPTPKLPGTTVSTWVLEGKLGDTPLEIHGRTVYKPLPWSCD